ELYPRSIRASLARASRSSRRQESDQVRGAMSPPQHVSSSRPCPTRLAYAPNEIADGCHQSQARTAYGEQRHMLDRALSGLPVVPQRLGFSGFLRLFVGVSGNEAVGS